MGAREAQARALSGGDSGLADDLLGESVGPRISYVGGRRQDAEWSEEDHPRDPSGRFGVGAAHERLTAAARRSGNGEGQVISQEPSAQAMADLDFNEVRRVSDEIAEASIDGTLTRARYDELYAEALEAAGGHREHLVDLAMFAPARSRSDADDWDESKHVRGPGGKFGEGGGENAPAATGVMNDLIAARDLLTTAMATAPTGHFPGSKGWLEEKAAMKALDEFDRAHPDVRAAHIASRRD